MALDDGFSKVKKTGLEPFVKMVEGGDRNFFKAKEFIELFDVVFKMCIQREPYNWSAGLYEKYSNELLQYCLDTAKPKLDTAKNSFDHTALLKEWRLRWSNFKTVLKGFSKIFMYLDKFYTQNADRLATKLQGYKIYKENVFDTFVGPVRNAILNCITKERNGEEQDRNLLKECVEVFVEMGQNYQDKGIKIYQIELEKYLLDHIADHYRRSANTWMSQDECPAYLAKAERILSEEKGRVESYLHRTTLDSFLKECYARVLKAHQNDLLRKNTGLVYMLSQNLNDDLTRMYRLYSKYTDDLEPIAGIFQEHIAALGSDMVDKVFVAGDKGDKKAEEKKDEKKAEAKGTDHDLVKNLIELHARFGDMVKGSFQNNAIFQKALKKAFEVFVNKDTRLSKLLAVFAHEVLKKNSTIAGRDLEKTLDNVVFLFGYITDKDVFEFDYETFLADRLLMGTSESEHREKAMIAKLKIECGYQWTNKLETMFKDVQQSKLTVETFKKDIYDPDRNEDLSFHVNVCTKGIWPSTPAPAAIMPSELKTVTSKFRNYYCNKHNNHKLDWRLDMGQAEVQITFAPGMTRTFVCTTYMMLVLLLFNNNKVLTAKKVAEIIGVPLAECENHILSLVHPKVGVLLKLPMTATLEEDHKLKLNDKFNSKLLKTFVNLIPSRTRAVGVSQEKVNQTRQHIIDAAIVRIMKSRNHLKHNDLIAEVVSQLKARFVPAANVLRQRIETMIELEYMKRDPNDRSSYIYLA